MKLSNKIFTFFAALAVAAIALVSCGEKDNTVGGSISPVEDRILVAADTFRLTTFNSKVDYIYCNADSFLLGMYSDPTFGTTQADLFTQLACLEGYSFPKGAVLDSMLLFINYNDWYGHQNAVIDISVYEMDVATFDYGTSYPSNIEPSDYCTKSTLVAQRTVSALHPTDSLLNNYDNKYHPVVVMRLNDEWASTFFAEMQKHSQDQDTFNEFFKGFYITSQFGNSTVLYVNQIDLHAYYHYDYEEPDGTKIRYNDVKTLPANREVRTINRFYHPDQDEVFERLSADTKYNYVSSPSNMFAHITLPLDNIIEKIDAKIPEDRRLYLNGAILQVDVMNTEEDSPAKQMLLIKTEAMENFFLKNEILTDTCAIVSSLNTGVDSKDSTYYYYAYDLSYMLVYFYRDKASYDNMNLDLTLVPVMVESPAQGLSAVRPLNTMSATRIYSGANSDKPLTLKLLYSGF